MRMRIGTVAAIGLATACLFATTTAIATPIHSPAQTNARRQTPAVTASCSRAVKYDGGTLQGGFYRYRDMTCHLARSIVRGYLEHGLAPHGYRCSYVPPRPSRPEGAILCTAGKPLVEFGSE
jgi:hypothetical protein